MAALQHGMQEHAGQLGEAGDADLDHRADVGDGQVGELAGGAVARVVDEDFLPGAVAVADDQEKDLIVTFDDVPDFLPIAALHELMPIVFCKI